MSQKCARQTSQLLMKAKQLQIKNPPVSPEKDALESFLSWVLKNNSFLFKQGKIFAEVNKMYSLFYQNK